MNEHERAVGLAPTPQYRYADRVGDQLFVAGQVPLDGTGQLVAAWAAVTAWFSGAVPPATLLGAHLLGYHGQLVEVDARIARTAAGSPS